MVVKKSWAREKIPDEAVKASQREKVGTVTDF